MTDLEVGRGYDTETCFHCHEEVDAEIIEICHCCRQLACPWCIDDKP